MNIINLEEKILLRKKKEFLELEVRNNLQTLLGKEEFDDLINNDYKEYQDLVEKICKKFL